VQTNLFPTEAFNHPNFNLMGKTIFSPVCSGDWWHYEKVGDYALMVVGKIENRGLTAAMLTAVVRGAISTFVSTTKILPQNMAPIFKLLVNHLNSAIYDCTRGKEKMKCFIGILDLRSGKLTSINCDFTPPLLHRIRFGGRPENYEDRFVRLASGAGVALGSTNKMEIVPVVNQLSPGDMIFWYSPQITEKVNLHKTLGKAWDDYGCQSKRLVEKTMETVSSSLGKSAQSPPDDLTLVVATVPKEAYFVQAEAEKAA
jgi:serine phosphatase RsbU (regulator of sigma subunit)